jgi:hypothetical protein
VVDNSLWLLLTVLLATVLLIVQRAERNRRTITFIVMLGVATIVSSYGVYRISNNCPLVPPFIGADAAFDALCNLETLYSRQQIVAYNTVNRAWLAALVLNGLFWMLIGRYNPPRSSEEILVIGLE